MGNKSIYEVFTGSAEKDNSTIRRMLVRDCAKTELAESLIICRTQRSVAEERAKRAEQALESTKEKLSALQGEMAWTKRRERSLREATYNALTAAAASMQIAGES